jgi:hypothetical protein
MAERKAEPAPPVQNPVEIEANDEGFGIDLEKELLGAFDGDEPAPSVEPEERMSYLLPGSIKPKMTKRQSPSLPMRRKSIW